MVVGTAYGGRHSPGGRHSLRWSAQPTVVGTAPVVGTAYGGRHSPRLKGGASNDPGFGRNPSFPGA
jgi:hypothetical protein